MASGASDPRISAAVPDYPTGFRVGCLSVAVFSGIVPFLWLGGMAELGLVHFLCGTGILVLYVVHCLLSYQWRRYHPRPGCLILLSLPLIAAVVKAIELVLSLCDLPAGHLSAVAVVLVSSPVAFGPLSFVLISVQAMYYQGPVAEKLQRDLGFRYRTNTLEGAWPTGHKYMFFEHLQSGGLLEQCGAKVRDIVLEPRGFTDFFQQLEKARGGEPATVTVVAWDDPGPIRDRPRRQLKIRVPGKNYSARLERDLGFRCDVQYFKEADRWVGVLTVRDVKPGKPFDQAGFRDRDIVLNEGGVPHLFENLERARGQEISLVVVPWIDPPDVLDRPTRRLVLQVPPKVPDSDQRLDLERELGYCEGWEWLPHGGKWQGTPTIESLQPDGVLAQAGFQEKDIPLEGFELRDRWANARGKEAITVVVASWVEPVPLRERPRRTLTVRIPSENS